jgi:hypothetical protein
LKPAASWLEELFPEVSPLDYYGRLFPSDLMEAAGEFVQGKYCGIAISLDAEGKAKRTQITKGLPQMQGLIGGEDFTMIAPVLFAGRRATNEAARYLTALEFDLDFLRLDKGELRGMVDFLYQTSLSQLDPFNRLPRPSFVIASSARNLHVVYLLDEPIPLYPHVLESVRNFRRSFIPKLWDSYITEASKHPQFETSPVQAFRLVGSRTKRGDAKVRCFETGPSVNVEYLNKYSKAKIGFERSTLTLAEAKEKYPAWYQKRIEDGLPRRTWECHEGLYEWWLRRMPEVEVGHRYHYMLCLAAYAQKCGISDERLARDMALCRKEMDKLSPPDNPLTMADMAKALQAHQERFRTLSRAKVSDLSGLEIHAAKRNGRTREVHMKRVNAMIDFDIEMGEEDVRYHGGAPTKKQLVQDYARKHPGKSNRAIAEALGLSRNTVNKWVRALTEGRETERS